MSEDKKITDIAKQVIDDEVEALIGLKDYIDENFEETVDSGSQVDFTVSRQADNVQEGLGSVPRLQGLSYWYEYVASWMMGLRSLPYSEYIILQQEGHDNE